MFAHAELEQLLRQVSAPAPVNDTYSNTKLVLAYMRHGGCLDTCLSCLARMPVLASDASNVLARCSAPITAAKLDCIAAYLYYIDEMPRLLVDDLVFAMRFTPVLAERIIDLLPRIDVDVTHVECIIQGMVRCLVDEHPMRARMAALQSLINLCTHTFHIKEYLIPVLPTIVALLPRGPSAARLLLVMVDTLDDDTDFSAALPALVARGSACGDSMRAICAIACHAPQEVVRAGGMALLLLTDLDIVYPDAVRRLYETDVPCFCDDEVLAYMGCRLQLPPGADTTMRRTVALGSVPLRVLYARTYHVARSDMHEPPLPQLPDFDVACCGTVEMVPADGSAAVVVPLAPLARTAGFIAAHTRSAPAAPIQVPLIAPYMVALMRALLYDEMPVDDDALLALAAVAHMWCAPRLAHSCVSVLLYSGYDFYRTIDLAGTWPEVQELLRYHALERLSSLVVHDRAAELADIAWPRA